MASFAKVSLFGNLGADPETKYTPSGSMVVELRIAVNPRPRGGQNRQDEAPPTWYRVSAWDRLADRLDKLSQQGYIAKGRGLYIEGQLEPREWTNQEGQVRTSMDVTMTDFQFVGSRQDSDNSGGQGSGSNRGDRDSGSLGGGDYGNSSGGDQRSTREEGANSYGNGGSSRRQSFDDGAATNDMDDVPF